MKITTLILIGTFMDEGADGWDGASMTVTNISDESEYYEEGEEVFYFSLTEEIGYTLPAPASLIQMETVKLII